MHNKVGNNAKKLCAYLAECPATDTNSLYLEVGKQVQHMEMSHKSPKMLLKTTVVQ